MPEEFVIGVFSLAGAPIILAAEILTGVLDKVGLNVTGEYADAEPTGKIILFVVPFGKATLRFPLIYLELFAPMIAVKGVAFTKITKRLPVVMDPLLDDAKVKSLFTMAS